MRKSVFTLAASLMALCATAQDVETLRTELRKHEQEIARINKLINSNSTQQKSTTQNLLLLNQKIESRKKILRNLDSQISLIKQKLGDEGVQIVQLNHSLENLRSNYSTLIKLAYLNHRNNSLEVVLSSQKRVSQSFRNIANIAKVTEQCQLKAVEIDTTKSHIAQKVTTLKEQQTQITQLMQGKVNETTTLEREHQQLAKLNKELSTESAELKRKAQLSRNLMQSLQKQIETIIAQESRSMPVREVNVVLSGEFEQNKGRLPSPVSGGVVVESFGVHNHPTQPGIKVTNNGINIACTRGSVAKSVFEGEVKRLFSAPGMGYCVIVRHGKYLTVYSNLESVSVKTGDTVKLGDKIGIISNSDNILHFEIWNETTMLDPQNWLSI